MDSALGYWFRSRFAIFVLTLLLRLGLSWQVLQSDPLPHFWRASEPAIIATHVLRGDGFASPYGGSQPTAWLAPVYPAIVVAGVFGMLGPYTLASTCLLVALNAIFAALTSLVIFELGKRIFGIDTGACAAWMWASCLPSAIMPLLIWDTCLAALVLAGGLLLSLELENSSHYRRWGTNGVYWGLACLVNPAIIAPVPFWWWLSWLRGRKQRISVKHVALAGAVFLATIAPWLLRNYRVFHAPVFVRSNFGAELYYGNLGFESHPFHSTGEYQRMGELPYVREKEDLAFEWIRSHPTEFAEQTLRRLVQFWTAPKVAEGYWIVVSLLTLAGAMAAAGEGSFGGRLIIAALIVFPVTYYVTYIFPKYRYPIEPLMMVLAAHALVKFFLSAKQAVRGHAR